MDKKSNAKAVDLASAVLVLQLVVKGTALAVELYDLIKRVLAGETVSDEEVAAVAAKVDVAKEKWDAAGK